jgi:O-acetyl-ADP-ribose deacetylase (regulator of RNase III)
MEILIGDIFESKAQTIINTVNCVGIMGKGIAADFKKRYPEMFEDYAARCKRGGVKPGVPYLYRTLFPPQIINFPTKSHWRAMSRIEDIEKV